MENQYNAVIFFDKVLKTMYMIHLLWQIKHVAVKQIQAIQIMHVTVQCNLIVYAVMIANVLLMYVKKQFLNF